MKPVIKENETIYYVDEADFIKFVEQNSDYDWNYLCEICRDDVFNEEGKTYFPVKPTIEHNSEFTTKWIGVIALIWSLLNAIPSD
jgi:hypothetical protein